MEDLYEQMDLCAEHQWAAYAIAEKEHGFELAALVHRELRARAARMKEKRNAALELLPK